MTDQQLNRLPHLFEQIVINQRMIESYCSQEFVSVDRYKELLATRRNLAQAADKLYRPLTTRGGPAHA